MRKIFTICMFLTVFSCLNCSHKPTKEELKRFAASEHFPPDKYLDTVTNRKALVILAHDDDDCAMAGTICKLQKAGWQIEQWTAGNTPLADNRDEHPSVIISDGNHLFL